MRGQAACLALLGTGIHPASSGQAPRQPSLLPAPRGAADPPNPRAPLRTGIHHQRRAQPLGRKPERGFSALRDLVGLCTTRARDAERQSFSTQAGAEERHRTAALKTRRIVLTALIYFSPRRGV